MDQKYLLRFEERKLVVDLLVLSLAHLFDEPPVEQNMAKNVKRMLNKHIFF
jgi:hypothetical protein